ncbi:acetyltransferase [Thiomicrorhabdus sp. zzn3]|uniref:acetyltransferase n=1 Tax=Thiomicrorhabdus sp. zzn3 TaxID=3039775 RepID=UPI0024373813|nr:acetyltransferase [Thiomicrorhabdus sp. zzn3]MDG6777608.1 acetyltransferase [Thiomicrorhabdus sp. zzn3]
MAEMAKTPLLLIGGGGHCRACIDVVESTGLYDIVGIVEAKGAVPDAKMPYPIIGDDADLPDLIQHTPHCLITVGQLKNASVRSRLFQELKHLGAVLPTIISPLAYVSATARLGEGTIVMHQALVNAYAQIGENGIVNSQTLVEHDAVVGAHTHLSTGCKINGGVTLGHACFVGSGAVIKQGVTIADKVVIGANSTVLSDITEAGVFSGVVK